MTEYKSVFKTIDVQTIYIRVTGKLGNTIVLDTEIQRNVVWPDYKKSYFIDSIIRGIIPTNIILNTVNNKSECIDGKQRITSIVDFIENRIFITEDEGTIAFENLDEEKKSLFLSASLPLVEYKNLTYDQQREIFERIQNGIALTQGELSLTLFKNKSFSVEFSNYCDSLSNNLAKYFNILRKDHYQFIMQLLYMFSKNSVSFTKNNLRSFASDLEENLALFTKLKKLVNNAIQELFNENVLNNEHVLGKTIPKVIIFGFCYYVPDLIEFDEDDEVSKKKNKLLKEVYYSRVRSKLLKSIKEIFENIDKLTITNKNLRLIGEIVQNRFNS